MRRVVVGGSSQPRRSPNRTPTRTERRKSAVTIQCGGAQFPVADTAPDRYHLLLVAIGAPCHGRAMAATEENKIDSRLAARCAAVASIGAAVIHFGVTPMHWRDWWPSGVFFAALAIFQLLWAFIAWSRPVTLVLAAGVAANAGAAGLWVMSCIAGPPVGPSAGQPEAVGAAGICVLLLQCYVVMGAGWTWVRQRRAEQIPRLGRALVLVGANTVMAAAVAVGLAAGLNGHNHHHADVAEAQVGHDGHGAPTRQAHHYPSAPQSPPSSGKPTAPAAGAQGLPVTDMGLTTAGDHEPTQHPPAGVPTGAKSVPAQPDSVVSGAQSDGPQHHHDD